MQRFRRLADDRVQLRLPPTEQELLRTVLPQLRVVLDGDADVEHLRGRLFPRAYDDPDLEREFRDLVGDELVEQRRTALDEVLDSLEAGRVRPVLDEVAAFHAEVAGSADLGVTEVGVMPDRHPVEFPQRSAEQVLPGLPATAGPPRPPPAGAQSRVDLSGLRHKAPGGCY